MRRAKLLKIVGTFILMTLLLAACGKSRPSPPAGEPSAAVPEQEKTPPVDQDTEPEKTETVINQEAFPASYIGKTAGDVARDFGDEYVVEYYEGSTIIIYENKLGFLFGTTVDTITDDLVIRQMMAKGRDPAVYGLTGSMTYSEIVEAVGGESEVPPPKRYFNEEDQEWKTFIEFSYREYDLLYSWENDTEESQSKYVYVLKSDVDSMPPDSPPRSVPVEEPADSGRPSESPNDGDSSQYTQDLLTGPGWFEGVMGCKFKVPADFTQQTDEGLAQGPGMYEYSFRNEKLDMSIMVFECTFEALPITAEDIPNEYKSRSSAEGVTYAVSGDSYYVVSGYRGDETIYYTRVDHNETFYSSLDFEYPTINAEACEEVLLEFLENYHL